MSRKRTDTSTVFFSSSVAFGFCSSSRLTASGTNLESSPLSCSSSSRRWRDSCRCWSVVASSVFLPARSLYAWLSRAVMSLNAVPRSPSSSREATAARASKSPAPPGRAGQGLDRPQDDRAHRDGQHPGRGGDGQERDQELPIAEPAHVGEDRLHRRRDAHDRAHRVVAPVALLADVAGGDRLVEREVGTAGPGARCIFARLSRTSWASPAVRATSVAVVRSVNASTPLRR